MRTHRTNDGGGRAVDSGAGPDPHSALLHGACVLLAQCQAFAREVPDAVYSAESQVMPGGSVGKHLRHLVDHYEAILHALASETNTGGGLIDYDHRERDVPMEGCRVTAIAVLASVAQRVAGLAPRELLREVRVRIMVAADGTTAELPSSLARELAFATHHGVHHQAMMKAIAGEFGVEAAPDFGKAPSTVQHEVFRAAIARSR